MNLIYIYIFRYIYIYLLISRSNIINLSVYEFINFRYMNVTLNLVEFNTAIVDLARTSTCFPGHLLWSGLPAIKGDAGVWLCMFSRGYFIEPHNGYPG